MYIPESFSITDEQIILPFLKENTFGSLVVNGIEHPTIAHLPFEISTQNPLVLQGHCAILNPLTKSVHEQSKAIWIISGPHAYVSSSLYEHENVPTYNYIAIHLTGRLYALEKAEIDKHLEKLVFQFEEKREKPLKFENFSKEMIAAYLKEIVCFSFHVEKIEAQFKLSQNRNKLDFQNIIHDLQQGSETEKLLATCMLKYKK